MADELDPVIAAMAHHESNGDPMAVSPKGAAGLMQLMPATAKELGVKNRFDPAESLKAGSAYLRRLYHKYEGDLDKALAAYNWGPGNVDRLGMGDLPKETREYIRKVKTTAGIQAGPEWGGESRSATTRRGPQANFAQSAHLGMEHTTDPKYERTRAILGDVGNAVKNWVPDLASAVPELIGAAGDMMASSELGQTPDTGLADAARKASRNAVGGGNVPETQTTPEGIAMRMMNPLFAMAPEAAALTGRAAVRGAEGLSAAAERGAAYQAARPGMYKRQVGAVKLPGGNFDLRAIEDYTGALLRKNPLNAEPPRPHTDQSLEALNHWVKTKVRNYLTKEVSSPKDSLRNLMDEGYSHLPEHHYETIGDEFPRQPVTVDHNAWKANDIRALEGPNENADPAELAKLREQFGPNLQLAKTPQGMKYENLADTRMRNVSAKDLRTYRELTNQEFPEDFVSRAPDDMRFHAVGGGSYGLMAQNGTDDLGLKHIVDTVAMKLRDGEISPEKLDKLSLADAAKMTHQRHVADAEAAREEERAARAKQRVVQKFDDGHTLVQLKDPGEFARESDRMEHSVRGYEPPKEHPEWIKRSGNAGYPQYGHGGYEAIKSGKAAVYSIRDAENNPGVTIEVRTTKSHKSVTQIKGPNNQMSTPAMRDKIERAFNSGGHLNDVTEIESEDMSMHGLLPKPEVYFNPGVPREKAEKWFNGIKFGLKIAGDGVKGREPELLSMMNDPSIKVMKIKDLKEAARLARSNLAKAETMLKEHAEKNPEFEYDKHKNVIDGKKEDVSRYQDLVIDSGKI
jgi:hypothetical protein